MTFLNFTVIASLGVAVEVVVIFPIADGVVSVAVYLPSKSFEGTVLELTFKYCPGCYFDSDAMEFVTAIELAEQDVFSIILVEVYRDSLAILIILGLDDPIFCQLTKLESTHLLFNRKQVLHRIEINILDDSKA